MRDLSTIIGSKVATSVEVNGLLIPANWLGQHLTRYAEPALFHTEGIEQYQLSKSGSLFKARINNRFVVFACEHQTTGQKYEFEQLCLLNNDTKTLHSSQKAVFPKPIRDEEHDFDAQLFDFTYVVESGKLTRHGWYDLEQDVRRQHVPRPVRICAVGFPSFRNNIDYEVQHYGISPNIVWGVENVSAIRGRLGFRPEPKIDFDPAGMSGGPVFAFELSNLEPKLFFAGILTNASKEKFNLLSISRLKLLLGQL